MSFRLSMMSTVTRENTGNIKRVRTKTVAKIDGFSNIATLNLRRDTTHLYIHIDC